MKLTTKQIKQLIKEELNKMLKESYLDEPKIPDAAPEGFEKTYSEFEPQEERESCNKYYKNQYDKYTKQLNKIERFSGLKAMVGMSRQQEIKELKFKIDGLIYWSARVWDCMWAMDLLRKWPNQKFQKFIRYIQSHEKPFKYIQGGYSKQDYSFTEDYWTLPQAEWEQRIEDERIAKEMGDVE